MELFFQTVIAIMKLKWNRRKKKRKGKKNESSPFDARNYLSHWFTGQISGAFRWVRVDP